jgi:hypothetical protein
MAVFTNKLHFLENHLLFTSPRPTHPRVIVFAIALPRLIECTVNHKATFIKC